MDEYIKWAVFFIAGVIAGRISTAWRLKHAVTIMAEAVEILEEVANACKQQTKGSNVREDDSK